MLSAFRQQLARDLDTTFLNVDEFAARADGALHTINGVAVPCIIDGDRKADHTAEGVYIDEFLLYVKRKDLPAVLPAITERMNLDGQLANVLAVDDKDGLVVIRLQWWQS